MTQFEKKFPHFIFPAVCHQLSDILKFGVDKLFSSEDSSIESVDFEAMLGPTDEGQWQAADETNMAQVSFPCISLTSASNTVGIQLEEILVQCHAG